MVNIIVLRNMDNEEILCTIKLTIVSMYLFVSISNKKKTIIEFN